ncbi:STK16 [Lepeophtheirus salmonis]|uniref:non-specific serine/threonine protein kinase n=1 Tax=Lepeophtheirus salmonis TaxID=72036 RepID=A0A7R8H3Q3_LEPSM|nr:STK16 [Lepeophtheirus salmonis]CAF2846058.1 STK16 [Lepeophtheirus salmonis]
MEANPKPHNFNCFTEDCVENLFSSIRAKTPTPTIKELKIYLKLVTLSQYISGKDTESYQLDDSVFLTDLEEISQQFPKKTLEINGRPFTVLDHLADGGSHKLIWWKIRKRVRHLLLKTIECHSKEDEEAAFQEIEYYKQLDHDNLVSIKNKGSLNEELTRRAESRDFFPQIVILNLFDQICEGLAALHAASPYPLAHRDLKPHNILLTNDFSPIIIDLGSTSKARVKISSSYEAKDIQDTAAKRSSMTYRSPELFQVDVNSELDERTDIWSLGCLLFALCFF